MGPPLLLPCRGHKIQALHPQQLFPLVLLHGKHWPHCLTIKKFELTTILRLVIPIQKIALDEDIVNKPIPTLSEKQFVVANSSLSKVEERAQRELFWYREELFKCVSARWHEASIHKGLPCIF